MSVVTILAMLGAGLGLTMAALGIALTSAPGWKAHRAFFFLAFACAIYCACDVVAAMETPWVSRAWALRFSLSALSLSMACWFALTHQRFPCMKYQSFDRTMSTVHVILAGLALIPGLMDSEVVRVRHVDWLGATYWDVQPTVTGQVFLCFVAFSLLCLVYEFSAAAQRGLHGARMYCVWGLMMLLGFVYDALAYTGWINGPYLSSIVLVTVMGGMSILAVRSFIQNAKALEALSAELEERVEERTRALVEAEAALVRSEKMAALGQLASGLAHEINNPAAAVVGNLEYLAHAHKRGQIPEDTLECVKESVQAMDRIAEIVRHLLDAGRPLNKEQSPGVTNLARAAADAVAHVRTTVPASAELKVDVPEDLHTLGEPHLLEKILTHLLVNSTQAICVQGGAGKIEVRAQSQGPEILLEVVDDGCGMDEQTQRNIFNPFFTTRAVGQGSGLGLSVTAGLVNTLGGTLSVQSSKGAGTAMRLKLPAVGPPA